MPAGSSPSFSTGHARSRVAGAVPHVALDETRELPLYEQLYHGLRLSILTGDLRPDTRLASTRVLATELGVSRFTVLSAVERLIVEGYLTSRHGAGTFVAETLPEHFLRSDPPRLPRGARSRVSAHAAGPNATLSARGRALSAIVITGPRHQTAEPVPFRPRRPPLDVFPYAQWARLIRKRWSAYRHDQLDYGDPAGFRPLREAIAQHVAATRGVRCAADQVIVTSGSQQAFDILFRLLLDPGESAWMEEPGYLDVRGALIGAGARIVPVPVDSGGIDVDAGMRLAPRARLAVVSPSHQYPMGVTLSLARRVALIEWARRANAWLIEDDYDSYFRYRGRPLSALQQLDADANDARAGSERVIYVGTFSKTLFPSLRLGFCVVPPSLADAVANARAVADRNSPIADQAALAEFIADGHYDRHLRRVRTICAERHEAMLHHLHARLDDVLEVRPATAGTHLLGFLRNVRKAHSGPRLQAIARDAAAAGMVLFPLSRYCLTRARRDGLVLGYGGLPVSRIASGVAQLARIITQAGKR